MSEIRYERMMTARDHATQYELDCAADERREAEEREESLMREADNLEELRMREAYIAQPIAAALTGWLQATTRSTTRAQRAA